MLKIIHGADFHLDSPFSGLTPERAAQRPQTLMDIATIGAKTLKKRGLLPELDESEEINACSIHVPALVDGEEQDWLLMFKNETHNHPTEIEPFGGAATCIGGCIRDPLSGRAYVHQAMRVTGCGDPRASFEDTLPGKLPQRKLATTAAAGYSSYGNQIGLATGHVAEIYHPGYMAKHLECGAVAAAAPAANVRRETGEQAKVLNYILRNWGEVRPEEFEDELKELIGHTPFQVAMGAVLGVAVGLAGSFIAFGV